MVDRLQSSIKNRIDAADVRGGKLIIKRYDRSRIEFEGGGGGFDPDTGGPAMYLGALTFGSVDPQTGPIGFYTPIVSQVKKLNPDGSQSSITADEVHGLFECGPFLATSNGVINFTETGIYLVTLHLQFAANATGMRWPIIKKNQIWSSSVVSNEVTAAATGATEADVESVVIIGSGDVRNPVYDEENGWDPTGTNVELFASHSGSAAVGVAGAAKLVKIG